MRVVLHAHSKWSYDGSWTLADIAKLYGRWGVDVVMMTEHDTGFDPDRFAEYRAECAVASTPRCKLIPGIEYSSPDNDIHILTWGLHQFLAEHRPVAETLEKVAAGGGVAVFAHPIRRNAWQQYDPAWTPLLSGMEVWNRKSDGVAPGVEALSLMEQTGLPPTVGQDFHKLKQLYPLTHQVEIEGEDLEAGLVEAIRDGALTPQAFRRNLFGRNRALRAGVHRGVERVRRSVRDLRNLVRGRKS